GSGARVQQRLGGVARRDLRVLFDAFAGALRPDVEAAAHDVPAVLQLPRAPDALAFAEAAVGDGMARVALGPAHLPVFRVAPGDRERPGLVASGARDLAAVEAQVEVRAVLPGLARVEVEPGPRPTREAVVIVVRLVRHRGNVAVATRSDRSTTGGRETAARTFLSERGDGRRLDSGRDHRHVAARS